MTAEDGAENAMKILSRVWKVLGQVLGEEDYARYCAHLRAQHPDLPAPSAGEFYLIRLKERYSRPSRCC